MWLVVMFDLPTLTLEERKSACRFRTALLRQGFAMLQLSVYVRRCRGLPETTLSEVRRSLPASGNVCIVELTDQQYEAVAQFDSGRRVVFEKPSALVMF